jgi:hypothetical protein
VKVPIKPFVYHHINDWIARLLSRKDLEEYVDQACDSALQSSRTAVPESLSNLLHGPYMRNFRDGEGKLFLDRGSEFRLVFSFNLDNFNVNQVLAGGATRSTGLMSLACLNLPPGIRYKPMNMWMSLIPGPKGADETCNNHLLRPLVDDLLTGWERGIHLSRTASQMRGRDGKYAVVAWVMDLQGVRKCLAAAHHNAHHFCTACHCYGAENGVNERTRTDLHNWKKKDGRLCKQQACAWRDATRKERVKLFQQNGMRYGEVNRLPYFDIVQQTAPDPMHGCWERVCATHIREYLGLEYDKDQIVPAYTYKFKQPPSKRSAKVYQQGGVLFDKPPSVKNEIKLIHKDLTAPIDDERTAEKLQFTTQNRPKPALQFVCQSLSLEKFINGESSWTRQRYAEELVKWVCIA